MYYSIYWAIVLRPIICVRLFVTVRPIAHQAALSVGVGRKKISQDGVFRLIHPTFCK